jgi:hypothetical protein
MIAKRCQRAAESSRITNAFAMPMRNAPTSAAIASISSTPTTFPFGATIRLVYDPDALVVMG